MPVIHIKCYATIISQIQSWLICWESWLTVITTITGLPNMWLHANWQYRPYMPLVLSHSIIVIDHDIIWNRYLPISNPSCKCGAWNFTQIYDITLMHKSKRLRLPRTYNTPDFQKYYDHIQHGGQCLNWLYLWLTKYHSYTKHLQTYHYAQKCRVCLLTYQQLRNSN